MSLDPRDETSAKPAMDELQEYRRGLEAAFSLRTQLLHATWISMILIGICWIVPGPASPLLLGSAGLSVAVMFSFAYSVSASTPDKGMWVNSFAVLALYLSCLLNVGVPDDHTYRLEALILGMVMLFVTMVLSFVAWRYSVAETKRLRIERDALLASLVDKAMLEDLPPTSTE